MFEKAKTRIEIRKRRRATEAKGLMSCPDCGGKMRQGPRAGLCVNLKCEHCGEEWNYTYVFDRLERLSDLISVKQKT